MLENRKFLFNLFSFNKFIVSSRNNGPILHVNMASHQKLRFSGTQVVFVERTPFAPNATNFSRFLISVFPFKCLCKEMLRLLQTR